MVLKEIFLNIFEKGEIIPEFEETEDYVVARFLFEGDPDPGEAEVNVRRSTFDRNDISRDFLIDETQSENEKLNQLLKLGLISEPQHRLAESVDEIDIDMEEGVEKEKRGISVKLDGRIDKCEYTVSVIPKEQYFSPETVEFEAWELCIDYENREIERGENEITVKFPKLSSDIDEKPEIGMEELLDQNEKKYK